MSGPKSMKLEMNAEFPYEEESSHAGLGSTRTVGWAVKGTPFRVLLKVVSKSKASLAHAQVHLQLLTEETYAPIEIGDRPVTWEHSASGSVIACDVRLQVLSTQLAKSCVIIKATVIVDGQKLEVMSCPIKVVSKPEQIRKKRKEANQNPELEGSKKRARSEDVLVELRSIHSSLLPAVDALRHSQRGAGSSFGNTFDEASMDLSEDAHEDDYAEDYETATNVTTDDDRTAAEMASSFCESMDEDPSSSQNPPSKSRSSLISTFEMMLQSFVEAHNENSESLASDPSLDRLRSTFNFLGLPNQNLMVESEEYH